MFCIDKSVGVSGCPKCTAKWFRNVSWPIPHVMGDVKMLGILNSNEKPNFDWWKESVFNIPHFKNSCALVDGRIEYCENRSHALFKRWGAFLLWNAKVDYLHNLNRVYVSKLTKSLCWICDEKAYSVKIDGESKEDTSCSEDSSFKISEKTSTVS